MEIKIFTKPFECSEIITYVILIYHQICKKKIFCRENNFYLSDNFGHFFEEKKLFKNHIIILKIQNKFKKLYKTLINRIVCFLFFINDFLIFFDFFFEKIFRQNHDFSTLVIL